MDDLRGQLRSICSQYRPVTVRQVFYRAVAQGLVEKTESAYRGTVARLLAEMRRDGVLPFSWISDNTRWMRKPSTYNGIAEMMGAVDGAYRRDLWSQADVEVEIWLEKEALAGVLYEVTEEMDVALMVTRGYPSISFTYSAAQSLGYRGATYIYYFGDLDSHGLRIEETVQSHLAEFGAPDITFERVAVTEQQVSDWNLPTRPDKGGRSWAIEVDAIEPDELRRLCREVINQHVDQDQLAYLRRIETLEKSIVSDITWATQHLDGDIDPDELEELADLADAEGGGAVLTYLRDGEI